MLFQNLMHEPCKPGRKHQLDEDGTEDVMHEPPEKLDRGSIRDYNEQCSS